MKPSLLLLRALASTEGAADTFDLAASTGLDLDRTARGLLLLQAAGLVTIRRGQAALTDAGRAAWDRKQNRTKAGAPW